MGGGSVTSEKVRSYYNTSAPHIESARSAREVFRQSRTYEAFRPENLKNGIRESRDSGSNPNSYAIIVGFDETGSMGEIPFQFIKNGFPRFVKMIQERALGYDAHLLFAAIGDVRNGEDGPLQVTQFEADTRMLDQLSKLYLEGEGGGNGGESYMLPWYFAAKHTSIDCYELRGKKGTLITIGDEAVHNSLSAREVKYVFGKDEIEKGEISTEECLRLASEKYNVYHIIVKPHPYQPVRRVWHNLLGNRAIELSDYDYIPELIACILKCQEGMSKEEAVLGIEDRNGRIAVERALRDAEILPTSPGDAKSSSGQGFKFV